MSTAPQVLAPSTFEQAAAALAAASAEGRSARIRGSGTKLTWGHPVRDASFELRSSGLSRIVEHNAGDLTAVLKAGVPLGEAQQTFAGAAQMLALDPPLGPGHSQDATIGGVIATADSGPMRHRYGGPRDLVLGITVALSDGTIATAGSKVIKNVAGYDLAKLFAGSFGSLGMILSVSVRLHPRPVATATALAAIADPELLAGAARELAAAPLELEALDIAWRSGRGGILARSGGAEATRRATRVAERLRAAGLDQVEVVTDDEPLWARQRAGQRSQGGMVVRVATRASALAEILRVAEVCGATLVGRAALGASYLELDPEALPRLRSQLPSSAVAVVLDAPPELRGSIDPWGVAEGPALELMRRVKARFDPSGACNRGVFVGGI